ncbi:MAG: CHAT domain-containing protein, partial [Planctomycetota bacterium]|nr:CHAT domain-containing protein [Planctomycetota bacterium]
MVRFALAVLLVPWLAGVVVAGDQVRAAADAAERAHASEDRTQLIQIARRDDPDPWLVAEALAVRGRDDVARAFAAAATGPDTRLLGAYLAGGGRQVTALQQRYRSALELARQGRELAAAQAVERLARDAHRLGWLALAARSLSHAGLAHVRAERWSAAVNVLDRLIVLERERANDMGVADAYMRLGFAHESRGDTVYALDSLLRSRAAAERAGDHVAQARIQAALGRLYHSAGNLTEAIEALVLAIEQLQRVKDHARMAHTLIELGLIHKRTGDLERASEAHDRAYAVLRRLRDKPGMAVALSGLGGLCIRRGEYTRALSCLEEARTLMEGMGNRRGEAAVLAQLGELYTVLRDAERAERCFATSFSIAAEIGDVRALERSVRHAGAKSADVTLLERALGCIPDGCDREACSSILRRLGSLHLVEGQLGRSLERHEEALDAAEDAGDPLQVIASLVELAAVHRAMATYDGALELDRRAVELAQGTGSSEALARALWSRAETRLRRGEVARAVQDARRASREASFVYTRLSEFEGSRAGELWRGLFDVGVEAAVRLDSVHDAAWFMEAGRAGMLLSALGGRDVLWSHVVPEPLRREEAHVRAAEVTALAGYRRAYAKGRLPALRRRNKQLREVRQELTRVLGAIRAEARAAANLVCPEPDSLETLQLRLRHDEALVLFGLLPRRVLAIVVTPTDARLVELGFRHSLERELKDLRFDAPDTTTAERVAALRARLITPLALRARVRRLFVSPMGSLGLVPLPLLVPEHEVVYVPSGTTYGLLHKNRELRGRGVLAIGDPEYRSGYDEGQLPLGVDPRALTPLPATRQEVEAVGTVRLLGAEATERAFGKAVAARKRWRAVHFACHGLLRKDLPMSSALALTADAKSDGFLTSIELLHVRVPSDLVVLSACDSGRGPVYDIEGVVGLARAFMFAGAPRVLCSLWKVDDEATRALMTKFYALWNPSPGKKGLGAAAALRQAQEYVR